ncbi:rRNA pseudouridine synthase [Candidatus Woesearchaeota archaeon]|nr:rRNA pseudouridine synthase [Candidatus Woesearchaeota archaeon]
MSRYRKRTIYQIIVEAGLVKSKKQALDLVRNEKVAVNGLPITSLHYQVNPRKSKIFVNNKEIKLEDKRRYFIFNKPKGLITTKENILKFLKNHVKSEELLAYYPVGRLDKDTTGLLIITNDGRLGNKILNPKQKITKTYEVIVLGKVNDADLDRLRTGVEIELEENSKITKYKTQSAKINIIGFGENTAKIEVCISEGKKRQVRRMFEALNFKILDLKRTKIGELELGDLNVGEIKEMPMQELFKAVF